jgi:hypothetical protein
MSDRKFLLSIPESWLSVSAPMLSAGLRMVRSIVRCGRSWNPLTALKRYALTAPSAVNPPI